MGVKQAQSAAPAEGITDAFYEDIPVGHGVMILGLDYEVKENKWRMFQSDWDMRDMRSS